MEVSSRNTLEIFGKQSKTTENPDFRIRKTKTCKSSESCISVKFVACFLLFEEIEQTCTALTAPKQDYSETLGLECQDLAGAHAATGRP